MVIVNVSDKFLVKDKGSMIIPPVLLLEAYVQGYFPMSESRNDKSVNWYSAKKRGIIPLDQFRLSRRMNRKRRTTKYRWAINKNFQDVLVKCADRETTWISQLIIDSYTRLHELGYAHSVEIYQEKELVAGLYGVAIEAAFFAESMFQSKKDMGKIALFHCHDYLLRCGYQLWDVQFYTPHLGQFGCVEIDQVEYKRKLKKALSVKKKR